MRYPSILEEILYLTNKNDEKYEELSKCYTTTKRIAEEVNRKKSSFKKIIEIENNIEENERNFSDSLPLVDLKNSINARHHSFKHFKEISNEVCIVCNLIIKVNPFKCSSCSFFAHHSCSLQSSDFYFIFYYFIFYF
jgi:hypothetical protein